MSCYVMLRYVMRLTNVYCDVMYTMGVRIQMRVRASIKLKYLTVIWPFRALMTALHCYLLPYGPIVLPFLLPALPSLSLSLLTALLPVQYINILRLISSSPSSILYSISTLFSSTAGSLHTPLILFSALPLIIISLYFYMYFKGTLTQNKMTAIRAFCPGMEDEVLLISDGGHIDDKGKTGTWHVDETPSFSISPSHISVRTLSISVSVSVVSFSSLILSFPSLLGLASSLSLFTTHYSIRTRCRGRQEEILQDSNTEL